MEPPRLFSGMDYAVFSGMLLVSAAIGVYHGCRQGGGAQQFLTASGSLGTFPVALSLLASFLSSITLLGQPAEVYLFGPQLWLFGIALWLACPIISSIFIPFFHKLNLTSAYEYFGTRFNSKLQILAATLFTIQMVIYLALVLYAPAIALYQVTGLKTEIVVSVMFIVVIFYTTLGGIKAVVWTDCFQVVVLFTSMAVVLIKGTYDIGGLGVVWERNSLSNRTDFFNWDLNPTERYTVWSSLIGAACLHVAVYGGNQLQIQRYLTVGSVKQAIQMLHINAFGWTIVVFLTVYAGMLIFARYFDCDPLTAGKVRKADQLFPLFVMDTLGEYPGLPGVFVAGIFSAGLSTVSTGLNSLAAIWYSKLKKKDSDSGTVVKFMAFIFGLLTFALVFIVPYMGGLVPVAISLSSFFSGSLLGLFILGMFFPAANSLGAAVGLLAGVGTVCWMTVGSQVSLELGKRVFTPLPIITNNCTENLATQVIQKSEEVFILFRVSFLWYSCISSVVTIVIGIAISYLYNWILQIVKERMISTYNNGFHTVPTSETIVSVQLVSADDANEEPLLRETEQNKSSV